MGGGVTNNTIRTDDDGARLRQMFLERFPVGWAAMVDCGLSQLGGPAMRPQHVKPSRIVPMRDKPPRVFRGTLETAAWLVLLAVAEKSGDSSGRTPSVATITVDGGAT